MKDQPRLVKQSPPAVRERSLSEQEFGHIFGIARYNDLPTCSRCGLTAASPDWLSQCEPPKEKPSPA
jgi:hypothetical protein